MAKDLCEKDITYHLLEPIRAAFERFFGMGKPSMRTEQGELLFELSVIGMYKYVMTGLFIVILARK